MHLLKQTNEIPSNEPRQLDPMVLEDLEKGQRVQVESGRDSKAVVDRINGRASERTVRGANGCSQRQLRGWWRG